MWCVLYHPIPIVARSRPLNESRKRSPLSIQTMGRASRIVSCRCLSEATLLDFLGNKFLKAVDVLLVLGLELLPEVTQIVVAFGVGDVLIVPPDGVKPNAQLLN